MDGGDVGRKGDRKMKRLLVALLVALAAAGSVFAAVSGELLGDESAGMSSSINLTLNLASGTEAGWFTSEPTASNWGTSTNIALEEDSDQAFENDPDDTIVLWAGVKSNENVQLKMEISGEQLTSATAATTPIAVTATPGTGFDSIDAVEWNGDGDASKTLVKQEEAKASESRVLAAQITFKMDAQDYNSALSASDYSADITLTVTAV